MFRVVSFLHLDLAVLDHDDSAFFCSAFFCIRNLRGTVQSMTQFLGKFILAMFKDDNNHFLMGSGCNF